MKQGENMIFETLLLRNKTTSGFFLCFNLKDFILKSVSVKCILWQIFNEIVENLYLHI